MSRLDLFATPLVVFDVPDTEALNRELVEHLLAEEKVSPGVQYSNQGGWHSKGNLLSKPQPCFQRLREIVVGHVLEAVHGLRRASDPTPPTLKQAIGWAMIMREGDYSGAHDHGECDWAIAYYVDPGDCAAEDADPRSGALAFVDPRCGVRRPAGLDLRLFPGTFTMQPRAGTLVVFPGWLRHYVYAYRGTRPRISVSSNLWLDREGPDPGADG